jgi:hypothetical protein
MYKPLGPARAKALSGIGWFCRLGLLRCLKIPSARKQVEDARRLPRLLAQMEKNKA